MIDLETRFLVIRDQMEKAEGEFNQATQCLLEALTAINERLERIETWIKNQEARANS
jgi:hypothetical protein